MPEPPITAEATIAHAAESDHAEREPTTHRRSRCTRKSASEDSNKVNQPNLTFAETLNSQRLRSGLSRYRLAEFSGISEPYILRLESGEKSNPSRDVVFMLGLALLKGPEEMDIWDVDLLLLSAGYAPLMKRGDTAAASA
jgi:ribosome-binding protein aMBF1 (putative translation factor)